MRLVVRQSDGTSNEYRFAKGPVNIGRDPNSDVFLPDGIVSRRHAVISATPDGKWMVEDLDSTNKTYLKDEAIRTAEIKTGDVLHIADFTIEVNLENGADADKPIRADETLHLEAALATPPHEIIVRRPDAGHAPAMRLAARRLTDFSQATEAICKAGNLEELLPVLLDTTLKQFDALNSWVALRKQPTGPMTCQAGKRRDGQPVQLSELILNDKITQAIEKGQFLVLPRVAAQIEEKQRIRSAMIAAIINPAGCFGVLYVDNAMAEEHYYLGDLDYLILVAMHTAAVLKSLPSS